MQLIIRKYVIDYMPCNRIWCILKLGTRKQTCERSEKCEHFDMNTNILSKYTLKIVKSSIWRSFHRCLIPNPFFCTVLTRPNGEKISKLSTVKYGIRWVEMETLAENSIKWTVLNSATKAFLVAVTNRNRS